MRRHTSIPSIIFFIFLGIIGAFAALTRSYKMNWMAFAIIYAILIGLAFALIFSKKAKKFLLIAPAILLLQQAAFAEITGTQDLSVTYYNVHGNVSNSFYPKYDIDYLVDFLIIKNLIW